MQRQTFTGVANRARMRKRVLAPVILACLVLVAAAVVSVSEAARITAGAVAEIIRASTGISSKSNFEVGLPPVTDQQFEIVVKADKDSTARLGNNLSRARLISKPATFGVSGEPNQVYSVALPTVPTTTSAGVGQETVVVFSEFTHDAGVTPSMGEDGRAVFAVGARVIATPAALGGGNETEDDTVKIDEIPNSDNAAFDNNGGEEALGLDLPNSGNLLTFAGTSDDRLSRAVREHDPFVFALDPRFLNVLVSYN
ncbi:MAG: DUF4402 domain-containing protein [Rhodospirillales bacterium]